MEDDDFDLAEWFGRPVQVQERVLEVLADVMMSLRDLPQFACDRSPIGWFPSYHACLETFYTKARLAAEFFVMMPPRDFTARTFRPTWDPPRGAVARLRRVWLMTSRHIVHLGRDRVPTIPDGWTEEDTTYGGLMRITRDAYKALTAFVEAYEAAEGEHVALLRDMHAGVKPHSLKELAELRRDARKQR